MTISQKKKAVKNPAEDCDSREKISFVNHGWRRKDCEKKVSQERLDAAWVSDAGIFLKSHRIGGPHY